MANSNIYITISGSIAAIGGLIYFISELHNSMKDSSTPKKVTYINYNKGGTRKNKQNKSRHK